MKPISIDFSGQQRLLQVDFSSVRDCILLAVVGLGVLLLAGAFTSLWHIGRERLAVEASIDRIEARTRAREASDAAGPLSPEATSAINEAATQLNYEWMEILGSFEKHANPEINVVSLELGAVRQGAKIVVEAPSVKILLSYLEALRGEPALHEISLVKQESVTSEGGNTTRFTLEAATAGADESAGRSS